MSKHGKLKIIPLGGLGEVGKNMTAYEFNNQILVVDAGIMFPKNDMLGIDYIIPDYDYLRKRADKVVGIVITHGHEDHIGAIHHVLNDISAPVYATPLTRGLIEVKLARNNAISKAMLHTVEAGGSVETRRVQSGILPHLSFHPGFGRVGNYHARRVCCPYERFQIRSYAGGWLADRLRQTGGVLQARRRPAAFRFDERRTPGLDAIRNGDRTRV